MEYNFIPIKEIVRDIKKLSRNTEKNKDELERLREILIKQNDWLNKIDKSKLDEVVNSLEGTEDYERFAFLAKEKEIYPKNSKFIKQVSEGRFKEIYEDRFKVRVLFVTGTLVAALTVAGIATSTLKKNKNTNSETRTTTQITVDDTSEYTERKTIEDTTTEVTTIGTTTENTTEPTTVETTTEATTIATTAAPTTTEATTIGTTTENTTTATTAEATEASTVASTTENTTEATTETTTSETTETQTTEATTSETTTQDTETTEAYTEAEQDTITDIFRTMKNDIIELYTSNEAKIAREKGKEYVVATIDFLFYGASINGITFKDLRSDAKEEVFEILQTMDSLIIHFDPDYKEEIGEKYNIVKNFAVEKYDDAKNKIIDKIGQEKYDEIISKKDEILDKITDTFKKYGGMALDFIKDKYEKWKNKTR